MSLVKLRIHLGVSRALKQLVQFNKTFTLQIRPLHFLVHTKMSSTKIVTSPAGYKCPTCNYRYSASHVKDGKNQI